MHPITTDLDKRTYKIIPRVDVIVTSYQDFQIYLKYNLLYLFSKSIIKIKYSVVLKYVTTT